MQNGSYYLPFKVIKWKMLLIYFNGGSVTVARLVEKAHVCASMKICGYYYLLSITH